MAIITGTTGTDDLVGTSGDDVLTSYGTTESYAWDRLSGGNGSDVYDLRRPVGTATSLKVIIDENSTDNSIDTITNVGALFHSASLGYQGWATAVRIGDDLIIHTPHRPHRFRKPSKPSYDIEIKDQYAGEAVEFMVAGGVTYALTLGEVGTASEDFMAGTNSADVFRASDGNDWVFGNGGKDYLDLGAGDDISFGGTGADKIYGRGGNDRVFAEEGNDRVWGGAGSDNIDLGEGNDKVWGGAGNDRLLGGGGKDVLKGGAGNDYLFGDTGDDKLIGGKNGDTYRFASVSVGNGGSDWGDDVIIDRGNKAAYNNIDLIELVGFYGPSSGNSGEAYARLEFERVGLDMVITADGGQSSITVGNMFHAKTAKFFIEKLTFSAGYWTPQQFEILDGAKTDIGDDRGYPHGYGGELNEILFGTDDDDLIYGNSGTNFIWTGAGADVLIYKENDPELLYGIGGGSSIDIVQDFDVALDKLDFTEIKGIGFSNLTISEDADGDAVISWYSGDFEISNIFIELRGVSQSEVTQDMFVFL